MFQEPIEERYNDLLKQRITLEGELALTRQQAATDLTKARSKNKRYLFFLILLPLLTYWWCQKRYITPLEQQVAMQQDSIKKDQNKMANMRFLNKDSVRYVVKKGDMLITLGQLFFNDTLAGYRIGIENSLNTDYQHRHLHPGDTLTIYYHKNPPPQ
ncbi:MAG: hypothetical protein JNL70_20375 [Saprospiraceae bacterium]|nr:hypothetical protein [Saprospiraceae bacterium]